MQNTGDGYASYLLRLRRIQTNDGRTWIPSIQSTATGEHHRFPSLNKLLEFLSAEFGEGANVVHEFGTIEDKDNKNSVLPDEW